MTEFNISFVSDNVRNNYGELSRLKSMLGLRVSGSPSVSIYILTSKLKKALVHEAKSRETVKGVVKIDRMITKLDKLREADLRYLVHILDERGIVPCMREIQRPAGQIKRAANAYIGAISEDENSDMNGDKYYV